MEQIQILANTIEALMIQVQELVKEVQELKSELKSGYEFETMRPNEAIEILGISRTTFETYKKDGVIPHKKVGGKVYVDAKKVLQLKKTGIFKD